jgi:hypothetical protein
MPLDNALTSAGHGLHPACDPVDLDPDTMLTGVFGVVADAIANQPRSLQTRIGPSEIGSPCDRRLGYKLAATPIVNDPGVPWKPFIGTAAHEQLAGIMARAETAAAGLPPRWHVEETVTVGHVNGQPVTGSTDLFDAWTGTVVDWKFTTRNMIREKYRPHGPGDQYRTQAHLYGRGWVHAGYPVRHVAVVFFTRDGEFRDRHVWSEPYDETIATTALARLEAIDTAIRELGATFTLPTLPAVEAFCTHCPWHDPHASDVTRACPGSPTTAKPAPAVLTAALT